jgi:hypothetical protein
LYLKDEIQATLRELNKITLQEVVKKQGDLYIAVNVLTGNSRILQGDNQLIESLLYQKREKNILKG